ncbi:MAG: OB-fold nucleic acid binding domain-containing protein, partial [Spirochaetia bacterium]
FTLLEPFAGYGFNKSHAAAYSVLAYKTAYLKANFPVEFMAANLTNEIADPVTFADYLDECRAMRIEILPPDVNLSRKHFSVSDGKIVYGLVGIKNVGAGAVDELERERESGGRYESFLDFAERVDNHSINRKVVEMFILSGLFDSLGEDRSRLYGNLDRVLGHATGRRESRLAGQVSLFEGTDEVAFTYEPVEPWTDLERLTNERELLGFYFSGHPLDAHREQWANTVTLDLSRAASANTDRVHWVLGLLKGLRVIQTRKGSQMAFGTLEDFNGTIELVFFSDAYEKCREDLIDETVVGMEGKVDTSRGRVQFVVEQTIKLDEMPLKDTGEVHIRIVDRGPSEDDFYHLRAFLFDRPGGCSVYLHLNGSADTEEVTVRASDQLTVSSNPDTLNEIQTHPQVLEVWKV